MVCFPVTIESELEDVNKWLSEKRYQLKLVQATSNSYKQQNAEKNQQIEGLMPYLNHMKDHCELFDSSVTMYNKVIEGYKQRCTCGFDLLLKQIEK